MLWIEVETIKNQLDKAMATCRQNGEEWAKAEQDYRVAKAKAIMDYKDQGFPTTLIPDLVKGREDIAELDYIRNIKYVMYKANQEAINVKKLELKTMESELEREYARND